MATTGPVNARYITLDALRGFAVMAILLMNIMAFAMPEMAYITPKVYGGTEPTDLWAWALSFILVDGKMRGLFTLLFGASMLLVAESAAGKGERPERVHYSRMFWLAIFGLCHFFFIWWGDILFLYAVAGSIVFLFRGWQAQRLVKWALIAYFAAFLLVGLGMGGMYFAEMAAKAPNASAEAIAEYNTMIADLGVDPQTVAAEVRLYSGSYWEIVRHKLTEDWYFPFVNTFMIIIETVPVMMIGMALMKSGFMTGEWEQERYVRFAFGMTAVGALLMAAITFAVYQSGFDIITVMNANIAWTMPARLLMTIGYAAALLLLIAKFAKSRFIARVAAAGRAAFTNYLGTSIVMTTIFYGYGFGLFGKVGRWELLFFVFGMWAIMLLWSLPWLLRFRYGPLEWIWRSLARRQLQPFRRT